MKRAALLVLILALLGIVPMLAQADLVRCPHPAAPTVPTPAVHCHGDSTPNTGGEAYVQVGTIGYAGACGNATNIKPKVGTGTYSNSDCPGAPYD